MGQVSDGGKHWAAMALNWSMPSAPPFISSADAPLAGLGSSSASASATISPVAWDGPELVDRDDLAVVVELGQHHGGLGEVLVPRRELDGRRRLAGHRGRRGVAAGGGGRGRPPVAVVVVVPPSWNGVAASPWPSTGAVVVVVARRGRRGGVARRRRGGGSVGLGRGGGVEDLGRHLEQHGTEPELGGGADQVEGPLLLVDAGELHDDRVALAGDLRLGHAEARRRGSG